MVIKRANILNTESSPHNKNSPNGLGVLLNYL